MFCKTIILTNSECLNSNAPKGILTLNKENNIIRGKIRLYNISFLTPTTKIGIYIQEKVHISPLSKKPNHYEFILTEKIDITQSMYCALIDNADNKKVILEGGTLDGFYFTDSPFDAIIEAKDEDIERDIDACLLESESCEHCKCSNCEYKEYFYSNYSNSNFETTNISANSYNPICQVEDIEENIKTQEVTQGEISTPEPSAASLNSQVEQYQNEVIAKLESEVAELSPRLNALDQIAQVEINSTLQQLNPSSDELQKEKMDFLKDIIYQLDEMFAQYPADDILNSIIQNSKFIKVENENPYVIGVIYENSAMKYIAFGVPASYNSTPPEDFGNHYQWLPLNPNDVLSDGYFMIYQDASTGGLVEINFD